MRFALVGGVQSAKVALDVLIREGADLVGVLGYRPSAPEGVSGYVDLAQEARRRRVENVAEFTSIREPAVLDILRTWAPDVLLVVGLSQLVPEEVRRTARRAALGFHPTALPRGRGRAPLAWLVLTGEPGAATLFELSDGADEGDILVQVPYPVYPTDHAADVLQRCLTALDEALTLLLAQARGAGWQATPQRHSEATYWGRRRPEDGRIDWSESAERVDALVRAASEPHPGAYTVTPSGHRLTFLRSHGATSRYLGVPGRVLELGGGTVVVACGTSAVRLGGLLISGDGPYQLRVGASLCLQRADLDERLGRVWNG
ncbi:MAG TPA: formyltransferase family protein [Ornithinicoccus sp.]|nr:formyltransferase family protein [Ornithinicoccus sp.]